MTTNVRVINYYKILSDDIHELQCEIDVLILFNSVVRVYHRHSGKYSKCIYIWHLMHILIH